MKTIQSVFPLGMDSQEIAISPTNEVLSIVFKKTAESIESTKTALNLISENFVLINDKLQDNYKELSNIFYRRFNGFAEENNASNIVQLIEELLKTHKQMIFELQNITSTRVIEANGANWPVSELIRAHTIFHEYLMKDKKPVV